MANTSSAKKATRKIARRTIINKSRRTQMRGAVRSVEEAIKSGDRDAALKAMARAEPELMQAAQRNIIHQQQCEPKGLAAHASDRQARRNELHENDNSSRKPGSAGLFIFAGAALSNCRQQKFWTFPCFYWPYSKRPAWAFSDSAWQTGANRCGAVLFKLQLLRRGIV